MYKCQFLVGFLPKIVSRLYEVNGRLLLSETALYFAHAKLYMFTCLKKTSKFYLRANVNHS